MPGVELYPWGFLYRFTGIIEFMTGFVFSLQANGYNQRARCSFVLTDNYSKTYE